MSMMGQAASFARGAVAVLAVACGTVAARADTQTFPVPRIVIYPGEVISEQLLVDRAFTNWPAKMPVHTAMAEMIGKVARQRLVPGKPISLNAIRVPDAVTQGKTYRIVYREDGLVISGMAVATSSGAVGDIVSLRNPDSGIVVRGMVNADGTVRMGMR